MGNDMRNWQLQEDVADVIGWHALCDSIMQWMTADDANRCIEDIAADYEINNYEEEDDDR